MPLLVLGILFSGAPSYAFHTPATRNTPHPAEERLEEEPGAGTSFTQPNQGQPGQPGAPRPSLTSQLTGCGSWGDTFTFDCALTISGYFLDIVLTGTAWILAAISNLFNYVAGVTLDNSNYAKIDAITQGWAFSRDVVNLFFIFILLFIAIATILQIESYGAKALLARLIIIALLVNFSLLAAQFIISLSNSLAILFYDKITTGTSSFLTEFEIGRPGFQKDIAGAFQTGLSYQKIFYAPVTGLTTQSSAPVGNVGNFITINIILIVGIALMVFAMAVFAIAAFLFIVRMTILWLLMILAPFGFVFLILPITRAYALEWWKNLTKYALFAPAFLFFVIITVKIIQSPIIAEISKKLNNQNISTTEFLFLLIIQSAVILVLMGGSLIVSQRMGIYGADAAIKTAQNAGKAFRGYAGRGALLSGARVLKIADTIATAPGRIPFLGPLRPLMRAAMRPLTAVTGVGVRAAEKAKAERVDDYKKLTPAGIASTYRGTVNPQERREIIKVAAEAGKLDKFSEGELQTAYDNFKDKPSEVKAYNNVLKFRPDLIEKDASLSAADKRTKTIEALSRMSEKDIEEKLDKKTFTDDPAYALTQELMVLAWGEREMTAAIRKHGNAAKDAINRGLVSIGPAAMQFDALYKNNKSFLRGVFINPSLSAQFSPLRTDMETQAKAKWAPPAYGPDEWEQKLRV
ncbi:MAG: hypothetical protein Q8R12_00405 [bacterium]|nr:hypothetical protein [bacterium]